MAEPKNKQPQIQKTLFGDKFHFNERFLQDHAGYIVTDPKIAVIEVIANAYDAGAVNVQVQWPDQLGAAFTVTDDGTGMTKDEFDHRWTFFNYDRVAEQGAEVVFPPDVRSIKRVAFGQSGKGRYAPFCFARSYDVESWKDGSCFNVTVESTGGGKMPFSLTGLKETRRSGHGTTISVNIQNRERLLEPDDVRQLIGSKFLVDPSFSITLNDEPVELLALPGVESEPIEVGSYGSVTVYFIDTKKHSRIAKLNGIVWWVNQRMVGEPTWNRFDNDGTYLDKRGAGRRYSFVVEADILKPYVNSSWKGFHAGRPVLDVQAAVHEYVQKRLHDAMADVRRERKKVVLKESRDAIRDLPAVSRAVVTKFVDEVQQQCPTMSYQDLNRTVNILARLEQSRDGYDLLRQLEKCSPADMDTWNRLMKQWTASSAEIVLGELHRRLRLIENMRLLVDNPDTDELHQLHPLFDRGLWVFGPEYEAVDFRSNRGLTEIIRNFLGPTEDGESDRRRPDLVVLPDTSIGAYSADAYKDGEISGVRKVLIIELKRGGFEVTQDEMDQTRNYARKISLSGKVDRSTEIQAVVLGALFEQDLEEFTQGRIKVTPMVYDTVLRKAEARTFNLQRRLKEIGPPVLVDKELEEVLEEKHLPLMPVDSSQ